MNILFIDSCNKKNKFGFKINKIKNKKIYSLIMSNDIKKLALKAIKLYFIYALKKEKTYVVTSNNFNGDYNDFIKNKVDVTEQNNLLKNDIIYINEYIKKEEIEKKNIKIVLIFDEFTKIIQEKLNYFLNEYKVVDVLSTKKDNNLYNYVINLNNKTGSVVQILDKIPEQYYNILLVFSKKYKVSQTKRSFCLDYNNSELDKKSNTYLIYQNNKNIYLKIFNELSLDISRFNKTKLGKLYMHASRIMLDK